MIPFSWIDVAYALGGLGGLAGLSLAVFILARAQQPARRLPLYAVTEPGGPVREVAQATDRFEHSNVTAHH